MKPSGREIREIKQLSSCEGKQAYHSHADALAVVSTIRRRRRRRRKGLQVYRCDFCGFWHLGRRREWNGR